MGDRRRGLLLAEVPGRAAGARARDLLAPRHGPGPLASAQAVHLVPGPLAAVRVLGRGRREPRAGVPPHGAGLEHLWVSRGLATDSGGGVGVPLGASPAGASTLRERIAPTWPVLVHAPGTSVAHAPCHQHSRWRRRPEGAPCAAGPRHRDRLRVRASQGEDVAGGGDGAQCGNRCRGHAAWGAGRGPARPEGRMRPRGRWAVAAAAGSLLSLLGPSSGAAQVVRGQVRNRDTGTPAVGVVTLVDTGGVLIGRMPTGPQGQYALTAPRPGAYVLQFVGPGFGPSISGEFTLAAGQTRILGLDALPLPAVAMDTVIVEGRPVPSRLAGFYQRRAGGLGEYLTREELERLNPSLPTDVLRRMASVNLVRADFGYRVRAAAIRVARRRCFWTVSTW